MHTAGIRRTCPLQLGKGQIGRSPLRLQMWRGSFLQAGKGDGSVPSSAVSGHSRGPLQGYRWIAVTSVGVLVWLGPWLLEPLGALGAGLGEVLEASLRLSLSAASICS